MKRVLVTVSMLAAGLVAAIAIWVRGGPTDCVFVPSTSEPAEAEGEGPMPPVEGDAEVSEEEPLREELLPAEAPAGTAVVPPRPDSAAVRGRLTDNATGEPLPFYALRLQDSAGRREELLTDEHGHFASATPMASGTLRFLCLDSLTSPRKLPALVREHAVQGGEAPDLDLAVASGPTYRFRITPPDAVPPTELRARLRVASLDADVDLDPEPLRMPAAGDEPWVRFAQVPEKFDRAETLDLESKDGLWVGRTREVSAVRGDVPGALQIRLDARGVLQGLVADDRGTLVADARILLTCATSAGKTARKRATTGSDGAFRFLALEEGIATLSVSALRHAPRELEATIDAERITTQNVVLLPLAPAGAIRGRLESETGTYGPELQVELRVVESAASSEKGLLRAFEPVSWEVVEGRKVGTFSFGELPAGKYEVGVADSGWFSWEPKWAPVSPGDDARFLVHDGLASAEFAFRVRDSDSGERPETFDASIQVGGGPPRWKKRASGVPVLSRFPLDRRFRWRVDLDGYQPALGDEKAFAIEETREGRVWRLAEVDLRRGWGEVFRVVSKAKEKPIAGATVRVDGRDAGTTGADGTALVLAPEIPQDVEIVYRDWKPAGPVDLRPVAWRREKRFVVVKLAPPATK